MKFMMRMIPVIMICLLLGSPVTHVCQLAVPLKKWPSLGTPQAYANPAKVPSVMWEELQQLDLGTGKAPPSLKKLDGTIVRVPGFVIPLEDNDQAVSEFLLVPFPLACIHVPAPPPNLIVHVKMDKGKKVAFDFYAPVWAQGRLKIQTTQNMYTDSSYFMNGILVEPYKPEKKAP
jgi:hypothetical protein